MKHREPSFFFLALLRRGFLPLLPILGLAFSASGASMPDSSLYHEKIVAAEKLPEYRASALAAFAPLRQSIAASRAAFREKPLPSLVRERMAKRFEISDRLETIITETLRNNDRDSVFSARRALRDLKLFDRYFKDELEYGEKCLKLPPPRRFSVRDFGARGDGVADDSPAFQKAFAAIAELNGANAELLIPKGKYLLRELMGTDSTVNLFGKERFEHPKNLARCYSDGRYYLKDIHLLIHDLANLTVRGETPDTELIFATRNIGALIAGCENLTLKDLTLRFGFKTHTQGTVEEFNPKEKYVILKLDEGYPTPDLPDWKGVDVSCAQSYNPDGTINMEGSDIYAFKPWKYEDLGERRYKLFFDRARYDRLPPGMRMAFPIRVNWQGLIRINRTRFCTLDNVTLLNTGFSARETYVTSYVNCKVVPARGSLMSNVADACFNTDNLFGIYVKGCTFRNFGDDGVNVLGYGGHIYDRKGNRMIVEIRRLFGGEFVKPGAPKVLEKELYVYIIDNGTGKIKGEALVKSVRALEEKPPYQFYELELDGDVAYDELITARGLQPDPPYEKILRSRDDKIKPDQVFFLHESGVGTVISGCDIGNNRHNSLTLMTSNMLIENNKLGNSSDYGILLTSYIRGWGSWREAGLPYNVVIRGNDIHNTVFPFGTWYSVRIPVAPVSAFRDILFENNRVSGGKDGLYLYNVNGLVMRNNRFTDVGPGRFGFSENCLSVNDSWDGRPFSPYAFRNPERLDGKFTFEVTDPALRAEKPLPPLQYFQWSKTKDSLSVRRDGENVEAAIQKGSDAEGGSQYGHIQTGFVIAGLPAGRYRVTSRVQASRATAIQVLAEVTAGKPGKVLDSRIVRLEAGVPVDVALEFEIPDELAAKQMRCFELFLGKTPPGAVVKYGKPQIHPIRKQAE